MKGNIIYLDKDQLKLINLIILLIPLNYIAGNLMLNLNTKKTFDVTIPSFNMVVPYKLN